MRWFPSDRVRTMVLWKQSRLGPAKPSADFRGSVHVHPSVRGDVGGRPGVVAAHGIDLSDGLDIDGGEGPERRLGGCLLLQTAISLPHPFGRRKCRCIVRTVALASIPIKLDRREGTERLELLKWGWVAKVSIEKDGSGGEGGGRSCPVVMPRDSSSPRVRETDYISSRSRPSLLLLLLLYPSLLRRDTCRLSPSPSPFCADAPTAREKRR